MASMRTWPAGERPRERLRVKGAAALGDAELIALLIGTGSAGENAVDAARRVLAECGDVERLQRISPAEAARIPGVGEAKAARLAAAFELGRRVFERQRIRGGRGFACSRDIYETYRVRIEDLSQEVFLAVGLSNKNAPVCEKIVALGTLSECRVGPREVFRPMIAEAVARIAVLHNHPSGDPSPSPHDVALTRRLCEAGELVGIPLLDHLVVGKGSYVSLRDAGLVPQSGG